MLLLVLESQQCGMVRVDLEDGLGHRCLLTCSLEDAGQIHANVVLIGHQARGRIGQAQCHPDLLDPLIETGLHLLEQRLEFVRGLFRFFLLGLVLEIAQIQPPLGN